MAKSLSSIELQIVKASLTSCLSCSTSWSNDSLLIPISSHSSMSTTASNASSTDSKKSVSFSCVDVREYDVTLGDNPACSAGPPISLGWEYKNEIRQDLRAFEAKRYIARRKKKKELRLSSNMRKRLLKELGFSSDQIHFATLRSIRTQNQRLESHHTFEDSEAKEMLDNFWNIVDVDTFCDKFQPILLVYIFNSLFSCTKI